MDDIEKYLLNFEEKVDKESIERERAYLSGLSKEEFEEIKAQYEFERTYVPNYEAARKKQPIEWESIRKKISETNVLIHIYNRTRDAFTLTKATWNSEPGSFDIPAAGCISFRLPGDLLKRIGSAKTGFKSSQISHQFTYRNDNYAFDFSTASQLTLKYEPFAFGDTTSVSRRHSIRSVGQTEIACEYIVEQTQSASPYSYAITIQIN